MEKRLAPVAVFVYNRLSNTKETIKALERNHLAKNTDVFVFSDAPKDENNKEKVAAIRNYLKTVNGFRSITVIERRENYYIERNIIEGVTEIINRFGKVIVLEDDGVSAPNFLTFMNDALDFYEDKKAIMHIASFTFIKMPAEYRKTIIWRYSENTGGGWATWQDRWEKFRWFKSEAEALSLLSNEQREYIQLEGVFKCLGALKLSPIPWDICWYIAITLNNGLAVNSPHSLVRNNGLFNGTHFTVLNKLLGHSPFEVELDTEDNIVFEDDIKENAEALGLLKEFYSDIDKKDKRLFNKTIFYLLKILVAFRITKLAKRIIS